MELHLSRAMEGVASKRSSSSVCLSGVFESGTRRITSFSSNPDIGRSNNVHNILNAECAAAIPKREIDSLKRSGLNIAFTAQKTASHTVVPITLKERWTRAARFAFLFAPTDEIIAVIQVPIFCPIIIGIAAPYEICPVTASA